jgi:hypothetical protein
MTLHERAMSRRERLDRGGIPAADLAPGVRESLARVDGLGPLAALVFGTVTLNGINPTPVSITTDTPAIIVGTEEEPFALENGLTLIVDPDGDGNDTVTFAATRGTSAGATSPSTNISGGTDNKFLVSVDGSGPQEIALTLTGLTSGAAIATAIQQAIRALEGDEFDAVTCVYGSTKYTITSGTAGTGSSVVVTDAPAANLADDLKLGTANGGTETAGTGDAANIAAASAEEVAAAISEKAEGWSAVAAEGVLVIQSDTEGIASSLAVAEASTADEVLGLAGTAYGAQGLGGPSDMANSTYAVLLSLNDTAKADHVSLSATDRTTSGFAIVVDTDASEADVDVLVLGTAEPDPEPEEEE